MAPLASVRETCDAGPMARARGVTTIPLLAALLFLALTAEARAQSLRGRSIDVYYSSGSYVENNLFYVAPDGRVFDLAKGRGGAFRPGRWKRVGLSRQRIVLSGRSLRWDERNLSGRILRRVFVVRGTTCTVRQSGRDAPALTYGSCRVGSGRPAVR